jgi:hypothetical protein
MKRAKILTGMIAAGAMALMMAAVHSNAWADDGDNDGGGTTKTVELFAVGNGSGTDDKTGAGCNTSLYPSLACIPGDFC